MSDTVELDLTYALGEIQNIQTELATYFDPEDGLVLLRLQQLSERLEGIEARLGEVVDTINGMYPEVRHGPKLDPVYAFEAPEG